MYRRDTLNEEAIRDGVELIRKRYAEGRREADRDMGISYSHSEMSGFLQGMACCLGVLSSVLPCDIDTSLPEEASETAPARALAPDDAWLVRSTGI